MPAAFFKLDKLFEKKRSPFNGSLFLAKEMAQMEQSDMLEEQLKTRKISPIRFTKEELKSLSISKILKKALFVEPERVPELEAEAQNGTSFRLSNSTDISMEKTERVSVSCTNSLPTVSRIPLLDYQAIRIISAEHLLMLFCVLSREKGPAAISLTRAQLEKKVEGLFAKLIRAQTSDFEEIFDMSLVMSPIDNNAEALMSLFNRKTSTAKGRSESSKAWTPEDDLILCGFVDSCQRRKKQLSLFLARWMSDNGLDATISAGANISGKPEGSFWDLVSKELGGRKTGTGCRTRWIQIQRGQI